MKTPSITKDELVSLGEFCNLCNMLSNAPFYKSEGVRKSWKWLKEGRVVTELPIDEWLFQGFLTQFRKLVLNDECTNFKRILNICAKRAAGVEEKREIGRFREKLLAAEVGMFKTGITIDGQTRQLTHKDVFDHVINSRYFHNDPAKREVSDRLKNFPNQSIWIVVKYAFDVTTLAIVVAEIVQDKGWAQAKA
jgi:hypothetical protein